MPAAFGHDLDPRSGAHPGLVTDAVAHQAARCFTDRLRHPVSGRARGQPAGFEHQDAPAPEPRLVEQRQGHAGGLAGARRRLEHGHARGGEGLAQGGKRGFDREGIRGGDHWRKE